MRSARIFLSFSIFLASFGPGGLSAFAASRSATDHQWSAPEGVGAPMRSIHPIDLDSNPDAAAIIGDETTPAAESFNSTSPTLRLDLGPKMRSDDTITKGLERSMGPTETAPQANDQAAPETGDETRTSQALFDGEVPVAVKLRSDDPASALATLRAGGFHAMSDGLQAAGEGVWTAVGSIPERAIPGLRQALPGLDGVLDLGRVERVAALDNGGPGKWEELIQKDAQLRLERNRLLARSVALNFELNTHSAHAAMNSQIAESNLLAAQTRQKIQANNQRLEANRAAFETNKDQIHEHVRRLEAAASNDIRDLSADDGNGRTVSPNLWTPPIDGIPQATNGSQVKEVKGISIKSWAYFYAHGFDISKEADKPLKIVGRLTGKDIDPASVGVELGLENGDLNASLDLHSTRQQLSREDLVKWLEIAEISLPHAEAPKPPQLNDKEQAAAAIGARLQQWGVPPHILNNSQDVVTENNGDGKSQQTLSPDAIFYFFKQGTPIATPEGAMLAQMLERLELERPGATAKLNAIELMELGREMTKQVIPWWSYDPQQAQVVTEHLYFRLRDHKIIRPLIDEPLGIDMHAAQPARNLREHLADRFGVLQSKITWGFSGGDLAGLHELAMAARFVWTQLAEPNDFGTIVHREGLAFLKLTDWERSREVWRLMPLGETVLYLGLDNVLRYIIDNKIKGDPMVVADAGLTDIFHQDTRDVVLIDRSGNRIEHHEFYGLQGIGKKDSGGEKKQQAGAAEQPKADKPDPIPLPVAGPILRGREFLRIDSHATAVATIMQLIASAMGTYVVSVDLPGFAGDKDVVPPGVDRTDFFNDELMRSTTAAIEKWGAKFFNFSWGGSLGGKELHAFLDDMTAQHGVRFTAAAGNDGPGFAQEKAPTFAKHILIAGAEDSLGSKSGFESGVGYMQKVDRSIGEGPNWTLPGGYDGANSPLVPIAENKQISIVAHFLRYIHIRGTSFSSPLSTSILNALTGVARHEAAKTLPPEKLNGAEPFLALTRAVEAALGETAEMLPGVSWVYIGPGRVRLGSAIPLLLRKAGEFATQTQARA